MNRIFNKRNLITLIVFAFIILVNVKEHHNELARMFTSPNTTFDKAVMKKIGNREVTYVSINSLSDNKAVSLHDPKEINSVLESLSGLNLKRIHKLPKSLGVKDDYLISVQNEQEITFMINLYNNGAYLDIMNVSKNKNTDTLYEVKSAFDEGIIKKYMKDAS